jgi:branched-chain amino acid transport system permease protein
MQIVLTGLISGFAIALLAIAFQAVYLPTRVFFVGLAGIYALAPFLAHAILCCGGGWFLAVLAALLGGIGVSLLCEWANHARLARRSASEGAHLIASLGIYIVIVQVIAIAWGNATKTLRAGLDSTTRFGGVVLTGAQWLTLGASCVLLAGFAVLLMRSDLGLRIRALADNPRQFALFGYNVDRHRLLAFGLAGLFASASSLATAYDIGFEPHTGLHAVLPAVVAVIIGGRGSFLGPVAGALLQGILRAQVVWHWSARWREAATFALLALLLLIRPQGLLGHKYRLEATS